MCTACKQVLLSDAEACAAAAHPAADAQQGQLRRQSQVWHHGTMQCGALLNPSNARVDEHALIAPVPVLGPTLPGCVSSTDNHGQ